MLKFLHRCSFHLTYFQQNRLKICTGTDNALSVCLVFYSFECKTNRLTQSIASYSKSAYLMCHFSKQCYKGRHHPLQKRDTWEKHRQFVKD